MMTLTTAITTLVLATIVWNPMKMCMLMVMCCMTMMFNMYMETGKSWITTNIFMLFMGGIILMFMILSSTLPNEKMKKMKTMSWSILTSTLLMLTALMNTNFNSHSNENDQVQQIKFFLNGNLNMQIMLSIMMLYFSLFILMMKSNKNSMRSTN